VTALVERIEGARFADGSVADVELWLSPEPVQEDVVFAAMVVVRDRAGRYAVVFSPRRQEWGVPGGWREVGESVVECALRELAEETGLRLAAGDLHVVGFERFAPVSSHGRWPADGGCMQLFRAEAPFQGTPLVAAEPDAVGPQWVSAERFAELSGGRFWWPLVASALREP
jgi:8-oxo-dGTP pyrophosphatase MutT (NUDIX family)